MFEWFPPRKTKNGTILKYLDAGSNNWNDEEGN